jgi:hypothetical protein
MGVGGGANPNHDKKGEAPRFIATSAGPHSVVFGEATYLFVFADFVKYV